MIRKFLEITIIVFISFEPSFAKSASSCISNSDQAFQNCFIQLAKNEQEESYIKQNKEAAKSSTNQAMFVVHRIKCLNSSGQAALNACNKAISINPGVPEIRNRKVFLSNKLNPKPQTIRKVTKPLFSK